jgi:hypothetical protein
MPRIKDGASKPDVNTLLGREDRLKSPAVGERRNYNFQGTEYTFWPYWTIEQLAAGERRYKARAIVTDTRGNNVVFTSYHEDYLDAERAIDAVRESLTGDGALYNIFAETIEIHTADHGGGHIVQVVETLVLIWSFTS